MPTIGWQPRGAIAGLEFYRDQREEQQTSDLLQALNTIKLDKDLEELRTFVYQQKERRLASDKEAAKLEATIPRAGEEARQEQATGIAENLQKEESIGYRRPGLQEEVVTAQDAQIATGKTTKELEAEKRKAVQVQGKIDGLLRRAQMATDPKERRKYEELASMEQARHANILRSLSGQPISGLSEVQSGGPGETATINPSLGLLQEGQDPLGRGGAFGGGSIKRFDSYQYSRENMPVMAEQLATLAGIEDAVIEFDEETGKLKSMPGVSSNDISKINAGMPWALNMAYQYLAQQGIDPGAQPGLIGETAVQLMILKGAAGESGGGWFRRIINGNDDLTTNLRNMETVIADMGLAFDNSGELKPKPAQRSIVDEAKAKATNKPTVPVQPATNTASEPSASIDYGSPKATREAAAINEAEQRKTSLAYRNYLTDRAEEQIKTLARSGRLSAEQLRQQRSWGYESAQRLEGLRREALASPNLDPAWKQILQYGTPEEIDEVVMKIEKLSR